MEYDNSENNSNITYIDLYSFPVSLVLKEILQDKTTKRNIIFAEFGCTADGNSIDPTTEITEELLREMDIQPRCFKSRSEQADRTRRNAEVFTPVWICNKMNNYCDEEWFGRKDVFNIEDGQRWTRTEEKILFPEDRDWREYVDSRRLEITCGEAPFIVSRYDMADGSPIVLQERIGILDRKMRVINENTETEEDWLYWTYRAFQSVYGYEYQGDNLLIARINLLLSFSEYMENRLRRKPSLRELKRITTVICWNIWQMDGLNGCVPLLEREASVRQATLFDLLGMSETKEVVMETIPCRIFDWREKASLDFRNIRKGSTS